MPRLSDSMEEGTILKWLVSEGDEVQQGQEIAEIETDKATMTFEADAAGVFHPVAGEGDTLPIGEVIATIGEDAPAKDSGSGNGGKPKKAEAEEEEEGEAEDREADRSAEEEGADEERDEDAEADRSAEPEDEEDEQPRGEVEKDRSSEREAARSAESDGGGPDGRVKASPIARRLAREQGVDLAAVSGTGPGGRIVKADVEKAASGEAPPKEAKEPAPEREREREEPEPQPAAAASAVGATKEPKVTETGTAKGDVSIVELTRTQQVVARRMAEAKATIPEFTLTTEIDMEGCVELRKKLKELAGEDGVVPSYNDMVVKACAVALGEYPRANGSYKDGKFELYSRVNVGVAVAAQNALVVPVIHDAQSKSLGQIAREARKLAARVRDGTVSPPELSGGTFTVSNLGMYGITEFTAVINPPQAAILAVGAMEPRPVADDRGKVEVRHRMKVTLACDHRILYGADAAEFLGNIRRLLEEPLAMAL